MARELFERKIKQIQDEIFLLGSMVEQATLDSASAFKIGILMHPKYWLRMIRQ